MPNVHRDWEKVYATDATPWDVGEPEDTLVNLIKNGILKPCKVLEMGCGHGNDTIFLAKNGFDVTAVDISEKAIETAKKRAEKARVRVNFIAEDVTNLKSVSGKFDFVYDRACFHFIPEAKREKYVSNLNKFLRKGGYFVLIVSSDKETPKGPYQFSEKDIRKMFSKDFDILEIKLVILEKHLEKPMPYFCLLKRK